MAILAETVSRRYIVRTDSGTSNYTSTDHVALQNEYET